MESKNCGNGGHRPAFVAIESLPSFQPGICCGRMLGHGKCRSGNCFDPSLRPINRLARAIVTYITRALEEHAMSESGLIRGPSTMTISPITVALFITVFFPAITLSGTANSGLSGVRHTEGGIEYRIAGNARKLLARTIDGSIRDFADAQSVKNTTSAAGPWRIASKGGIQ